MTIRTIDDTVLHSDRAAQHLARSDRRIRTGARVALDLLGIPHPEALAFQKPGPRPSERIAREFAADNPHSPR